MWGIASPQPCVLSDLVSYLSEEAPQGQLVEVHLEVVVALYCTLQLVLILLRKFLVAEELVVAIGFERDFEGCVHKSVSFQHLTQVFKLIVLLLRLAERQVVVLVGLTARRLEMSSRTKRNETKRKQK